MAKISVPQSQIDTIIKNALAIAKAKQAVQEEEARRAKAQEYAERSLWVPWGDHQIPPKDNNWLVWLLMAGRGTGKALDINTPIPTPDGWKLMRDIDVGDYVFDENGNKSLVITTSPIENRENVYIVKFSDGEEIIADENHLWLTYDHLARRSRKPEIISKKFSSVDQVQERVFNRIKIAYEETELAGVKATGREIRRRAHTDYFNVKKYNDQAGIVRNNYRLKVSREEDGLYIYDRPEHFPEVRTTKEIKNTLLYGKRRR